MVKSFVDANFLNSTTFFIIVIAACLIVLIIVIALLLRFAVFPKKLRKKVHELDRRFDYLSALLNGQDTQCVKRLEIISRTNLLYAEKYTDFNKRLKEIRNRSYYATQDAMNNLHDLVLTKKYKSAKEAYNQAKVVLYDFETKLNEYSNELMAVIKPEEDAKQYVLAPRDKYRNIKTRYHELEDEIDFLAPSFSKIFDIIDSQFSDYDALVESAHYDECQVLLPKLIKMVDELDNDLKISPNLCASIRSLIPDRLRQLKRAYNELIDDGYPLYNLMVKTFLDDTDNQINKMKAKMQVFDFNGIQASIDAIIKSIDQLFISFNKEKEAKGIFDAECNNIYSEVNQTEKRFIKLCNTIPDFKKVYIINQEYSDQIESIRTDVNKSISVKRTLDTYIHSYTKQPYSILVEKMHELQRENDAVIVRLDEYQSFLDSLKSDTQEAHDLLLPFFDRTKKDEKIVYDIALDSITKKYSASIDSIYQTIDNLHTVLSVLPIDVQRVNELVAVLHDSGEKTLSAIEQDNNMMQLVDATILYANRERGRFSNVDELVSQAETLYYQGDFEKAYLEAGDALRIAKKTTSSSSEAK